MSASSRIDLHVSQDKNDKTRNVENFQDGNFPALRPNYDRHMVTGHNTPQNGIPEFLTGRIPTQKNPLQQQLTQARNLAKHIPPNNTLPMVEQTPQTQNSDSSNPLNRLAEAIAAIASQQRPQTSSAFFKCATMNTLIFDSKNEKFEVFKDPLPNYA